MENNKPMNADSLRLPVIRELTKILEVNMQKLDKSIKNQIPCKKENSCTHPWNGSCYDTCEEYEPLQNYKRCTVCDMLVSNDHFCE